MIAVEENMVAKPSPGPESAPAPQAQAGSESGGSIPRLSNGVSFQDAIVALARDIEELKAKLSIQPLPNQATDKLGVVGKLIDAITTGLAKIGPVMTGAGDTEKRAVDLLFRLGEANLNNTLILNRRLSQTLGEQALKGAVEHVVATG